MKKKHTWGNYTLFRNFSIKLLRIMKLSIILSCLITINVTASVYSQNVQLNLNVKNKPIRDVLKVIEKQSEFRFFYNDEFADLNKTISLSFDKKNIEDALLLIFNKSDVTYKVLDDNLVVITPLESRQYRISGTIKDSTTNEPLIGVSITVEGTTQGALTDLNGSFSIELPGPNTAIKISYLGYKPQRIQLSGQTLVNVFLTPEIERLEEVVVVGYGTQRKKDVTGAISTIKGENIRSQGNNTIQKAIQGRIAGVAIESAGGDPGSGVRVLIRGTGSLNNNNPLYVVDGVAVDNINNLAPNDIASMDILKDASAAAIYGSRAANGVVLITTKSGKKGEMKIDFNATTGFQKLAKKLDVLNAQQWATVSNSAYAAAGLPGLDMAKNPESLGAGTDWQAAIYHNAPTQNYNLSASGGGENFTYSISGGYMAQDGIVKLTNYNRWNLRVKSDLTKGRVKVGETILLSKEFQKNSAGGWGGQSGNAVGSAAKMIPIFKIYDATAIGGYGGAYGDVVNIANPVAELNLEDINVNTNTSIINVFAEVSIFKGLKYKYNFGYTNTAVYNYDYTYPYKVGALFTNQYANLTESRNETSFLLQEHTLTYAKTIGKHNISALGGFTIQSSKFRSLSASKSGMPNGIKVLDAGWLNTAAGGYATENDLGSYLGRLVYSYDDRYVITATFRTDGSSRFASGNRWGNYPSIAAAWNISNEQFFHNLNSPVSSLKLRASYGILGNQELPGSATQANYPYVSDINANANYVIGSDQKLWSGAIQTAFKTSNIIWETCKTYDIGTDWGFFEDKFTIIADYFVKKNTDILLAVPIPLSTGASGTSPTVNAGQITNKGFEAALAYNNKTHDFTYGFIATISAVSNKVDKLGSGSQQITGGQPTHHGASATITQAGYPVGSFYLIKTAGIFNSQEEVDAYVKNGVKIQPEAKPGDIKFIDANNDGQITQSDRQDCGSPTPKFSYGMGANAAWKGIDISIFFQGTYGNKIYNGLRQDLEGMNVNYNWSTATLNAWTPTNHSDFPRAIFGDPNYNDQTSDRFLENGSYLRLKNLQLGYTLPGMLNRTAKISSARLFISFENLFTITKYKGFNPDLGRTGSILDRGVDYGHVAYPISRSYMAGIQLSF